MEENWITTDEAEDVAGSIRYALRIREFVSQDVQTWKWVALALHSALQGACVCHLTTSAAPVGAVTANNASEWCVYFEESRTNPNARAPKTYLMPFPDLLKAMRKPNSAGGPGNRVDITISDSELEWLSRFHNNIRNQFVHFEPMGWSIEVSGLPEIASLVSRIIGHVLDGGYAFRHQDSAWRQRLRLDLEALGDWPVN